MVDTYSNMAQHMRERIEKEGNLLCNFVLFGHDGIDGLSEREIDWICGHDMVYFDGILDKVNPLEKGELDRPLKSWERVGDEYKDCNTVGDCVKVYNRRFSYVVELLETLYNDTKGTPRDQCILFVIDENQIREWFQDEIEGFDESHIKSALWAMDEGDTVSDVFKILEMLRDVYWEDEEDEDYEDEDED